MLAKMPMGKVDYYTIQVSINNVDCVRPWEGDNWLMAIFIAVSDQDKDLVILNRVRKHEQVLHLPDILSASGSALKHNTYCNAGKEQNECPLSFLAKLWLWQILNYGRKA